MAELTPEKLQQLQTTVNVNRQALNRLKERVNLLERALELVCDDPQMLWLYRNRSERMDATVPMFPADRAEFHMARYEFAATQVDGMVVADIACGTGYGCRTLRETGNANRVVGVDISPKAIDYAAAKHGLAGVEFQCADAAATRLDANSFDCIVSFETIEHVDDAHHLIDEFSRLLKPSGKLICSTPNNWPLDIAPHHVRVYDRVSFRALLETQFTIERLYNQNSGSDFKYNHGQPAGMVETTDENFQLAECFIAVARRR